MAKTIPDSRRRLGRRRLATGQPTGLDIRRRRPASRSTGSGAELSEQPAARSEVRMTAQDDDAVWRSKNKRTVAEWEKDDGNYIDLTSKRLSQYSNTIEQWEFDELYRVLPSFEADHNNAVSKFSELNEKAIYNYTDGSGRFNIPLRTGSPFKGSGDVDWVIQPISSANPHYNPKIESNFTPKDAKKLEKALSRSFKHELSTGIVVASGADMFPGAVPKVGDITVNKGYTSTAYGNKDWAADPISDKPVRYIITVPKGSRILHVSGENKKGEYLSKYNFSESEILLRKNAVMRTTKVVNQPNGKVYVYQDFLGYGSPKKLSRRKLKGTTPEVP